MQWHGCFILLRSTTPTLTGEISDTVTSFSWPPPPPEYAEIVHYFAKLTEYSSQEALLQKELQALKQKMNDVSERRQRLVEKQLQALKLRMNDFCERQEQRLLEKQCVQHFSTNLSARDGKTILDSVAQSDGFGALPLSHSCCCLLML